MRRLPPHAECVTVAHHETNLTRKQERQERSQQNAKGRETRFEHPRRHPTPHHDEPANPTTHRSTRQALVTQDNTLRARRSRQDQPHTRSTHQTAQKAKGFTRSSHTAPWNPSSSMHRTPRASRASRPEHARRNHPAAAPPAGKARRGAESGDGRGPHPLIPR